MRTVLLLLIAICILSCVRSNKPSEQSDKTGWLSGIDTIVGSTMIISYKYPQTLKKDFIQNGLCFGKATPNDEEFLNDMRLCIWFNDERLENIDTIIASEGRLPNIKNTVRLDTTINERNAILVKYLDSAKKEVKQIVLLKEQGTLYQIIAQGLNPADFRYFLDNLKIGKK